MNRTDVNVLIIIIIHLIVVGANDPISLDMIYFKVYEIRLHNIGKCSYNNNNTHFILIRHLWTLHEECGGEG